MHTPRHCRQPDLPMTLRHSQLSPLIATPIALFSAASHADAADAAD